jgi:hypothetical protein
MSCLPPSRILYPSIKPGPTDQVGRRLFHFCKPKVFTSSARRIRSAPLLTMCQAPVVSSMPEPAHSMLVEERYHETSRAERRIQHSWNCACQSEPRILLHDWDLNRKDDVARNIMQLESVPTKQDKQEETWDQRTFTEWSSGIRSSTIALLICPPTNRVIFVPKIKAQIADRNQIGDVKR